MPTEYEYSRDNYKYPTWWTSENDQCLPHFHSSLELVYVYEGEMQAVLNGRPFTVAANEILLSPSRTVHHYFTEGYSRAAVIIVPLDFVPMFAKMLESRTFEKNLCREDPEASEIVRCIECLIRAPKGEEMNRPVIKGYLYVLLGLLGEKLGLVELPAESKGDMAREILIYLQNNSASNLTLGSVAAHFGYSKSRFSHIFNQLFGCGLNQYIGSLRCRNAASLMVEESLPLIDAAMNSGFDSMRTFYRSFKAWFGITPTAYCQNYFKQQKTD